MFTSELDEHPRHVLMEDTAAYDLLVAALARLSPESPDVAQGAQPRDEM